MSTPSMSTKISGRVVPARTPEPYPWSWNGRYVDVAEPVRQDAHRNSGPDASPCEPPDAGPR